jgi:hypothetical protein
MPEYRVTWEIDVEAPNPREAAWMAREAQVELASKVSVFLVRERAADGTYGEPTLAHLTATD